MVQHEAQLSKDHPKSKPKKSKTQDYYSLGITKSANYFSPLLFWKPWAPILAMVAWLVIRSIIYQRMFESHWGHMFIWYHNGPGIFIWYIPMVLTKWLPAMPSWDGSDVLVPSWNMTSLVKIQVSFRVNLKKLWKQVSGNAGRWPCAPLYTS